ncbi:MAG: hypothetical protein CVU46_17175, partial [Chloroflexi bacterium HGW-Chloroflexi-8]
MSIPDYKSSSIDFTIYDKMSLSMDIEFSDWLLEELKQRGWTQADLANSANINRQVVSTYINRQRKNPEPDVLIAIARAFVYPPEKVFRAAGLLPQEKELN